MIARRGRAASGVFVFLLLGVFAAFAMLLALLGARAYQITVEKSEAHTTARVLENFVINAVWADDAADAVNIENLNGVEALHITCDYDGEIYDKWVYCYDGSLRELFVERAYGFEPADGEPVCAAQEMHLQRSGSLITVDLMDADGRSHRSQIALRCAQ